MFFDASGKPFVPKDGGSIPFKMYGKQESNEHLFTTHEGGLTKDQLLTTLIAMGMK